LTAPSQIIFLDWNVVIELQKGKCSKLFDVICEAKNENKAVFPYSASHITEAMRYEDVTRRFNQLCFLSIVSSNLNLDYILGGVEPPFIHPFEIYLEQKPAICAEQDVFENLFNDFWETLLSPGTIKLIRNSLCLSPNILNNLNPTNIFDHLDTVLKSDPVLTLIPAEMRNGFGVDKLLEFASQSFHNKSIDHAFPFDELLNHISGYYFLLDMFGYSPDRAKAYKNRSILEDCLNVRYAYFAKFLLSFDTRFCKKAKAVFGKMSHEKTKIFDLTVDFEECVQTIISL
jgi:hypothetical protein